MVRYRARSHHCRQVIKLRGLGATGGIQDYRDQVDVGRVALLVPERALLLKLPQAQRLGRLHHHP